jgi:hypothetical protein
MLSAIMPAKKETDDMKIFVTKYALTKGILEIEAVRSQASPDMMYSGDPTKVSSQYFHGEGIDWHLTRVCAVVKAELMRDTRIKSLKKSLIRLEKLKFQ